MTTRTWKLALGLVVASLFAVGPAATRAHDDGSAGGPVSERELRQVETRALGRAHAAEHARGRRLERQARKRWQRLTPAQRRAAVARQRRDRNRLAARAAQADVPAVDGRWNGEFTVPVVGVHAILLPTGKVMYFSRIDAGGPQNEATAYLWDPSKPVGDPSALKRVDPPIDPATGRPANLWCAGQSLLADGQVLVTGGNLAYANGASDYKGLDRIYTFDPWTETWTEQPRMARGRWYPTQTLLPDGRTLITAGQDESGADMNRDVELFIPPAVRGGQGSVVKVGEYGSLPGSHTTPEYYPHWFVMPNGKVVNAGPHQRESWALDFTAGTTVSEARPDWARQHFYGTGVLLPGGPDGSTRVAQIGGFGFPNSGDPPKFGNASRVSEIYDEATPAAAPVPGPSLVQARAHHNTVLLPDGSMVSVGGGYGSVEGDLRTAGPEHLPIELWDPASNAWRLGPAQRYKRAYHSTALLLPDGRVVSAGDDQDRDKNFLTTDVAELYEPPYLFAPGERPAITGAPESVLWNQPFPVSTSTQVTRAVLVAPGATTHANDMHQRHVELRMTPGAAGTGADLVAPPSANVAPPGWYMLFVLSPTGKPSVARWIRVGPPSPESPAPAPPAPPAPACADGADNDRDGNVDHPADAGCASPTDGSERGANRLTNAGFELDADRNNRPDGWSSTGRFARTRAAKPAGRYAGRMRTARSRRQLVFQSVTRVAPRRTYRFRGKVNVPAGRGKVALALQVRWVSPRGRVVRTRTLKTFKRSTRGWRTARASFMAPAGTSRASLRVRLTGRRATGYLDSFWFGLA